MISGKRFEPFYGNAAADYTRVLWPQLCDEITDYNLFSSLYKQRLIGFIETKTETIEGRAGNPEPRHAWTRDFEQGIQSMGLPCVGMYSYPYEKCDSPTIASYVGKSKEEAKTMTQYLDEKAKKNPNIKKLDYNVACPNVKGCPSCYNEESLEHLKIVRENTSLPVFAKIGYFPEEGRLIEFGKRAENIGIDGVTAINSPPGMGIDIETGRSVVKKYGGVFGRGLKPLALRTVNILHENTNLDVIGLGGVYEYSDAVEFLRAGANAVQMCSVFNSKITHVTRQEDVKAVWSKFLTDFKQNLENYRERKGIKSLTEIIGKLEK